jgi:hypothetical protein
MAAKVTAANTSRGNQVARCSLRTRCASSRVLDSSRRGSSPELTESVVIDNRLVIQTDLRKRLERQAVPPSAYQYIVTASGTVTLP